jgi:hypothetical protein
VLKCAGLAGDLGDDRFGEDPEWVPDLLGSVEGATEECLILPNARISCFLKAVDQGLAENGGPGGPTPGFGGRGGPAPEYLCMRDLGMTGGAQDECSQ